MTSLSSGSLIDVVEGDERAAVQIGACMIK